MIWYRNRISVIEIINKSKKDRQYNDREKKEQTIIYKTLHRKLRATHTNPTENRKCKHILLH